MTARADDLLVAGRDRQRGYDEEEAGEDEDGAGGLAEVFLQAERAAGEGSGFVILGAADEAEDDPVAEIGEDERGAGEEENKEPAVPDVEEVVHAYFPA